MNRKLYSASEIAKMKLPGLPSSRDNIRIRAIKENWYSEERFGLGGKRVVYEIPAHYLEFTSVNDSKPDPLDTTSDRVVTLNTHRNMELLIEVRSSVQMWLHQRGLIMPPDKLTALVNVLYGYFEKDGHADVKEVADYLEKLS